MTWATPPLTAMTTTLLVDTSGWVDFLRRAHSPVRSYISDNFAAHTEPIAMEVLSGARDEKSWNSLQRLLLRSPLITFDSIADFTAAARLHRWALASRLRAGAVDCLILAVASRTGTPLLTMDHAQAELAESLDIKCTLLEG